MRQLGLWFILLMTFSACGYAQKIKVATYNIYFLDDGISQERKENLQAVIKKLDADIIGFQEITNVAALKNILPASYEIAMIDDPEEVQECALAVRQPIEIKSVEYVYPEKKYDDAFPRSRDLLQVRIKGNGNELTVLVHHAKSRSRSRMKTDRRRAAASVLIMEHLKKKLSNQPVVILGDFNDNPDDRSLNILETGDTNAIGGIDQQEDSFLFNVTEILAAKDYCSYGYSYLFKDADADTFPLVVKGARAENNKWRGKKHNFFEDVKVKAILFDQILVSMALKDRVVETGVVNNFVAIRGQGSRIKFTDDGLVYTRRGSLASDHVPVWAVLDLSK
ncbi:MAG: endonuclease/exonuclease/phosphatase family protein [bacterium]